MYMFSERDIPQPKASADTLLILIIVRKNVKAAARMEFFAKFARNKFSSNICHHLLQIKS